MLAFEVVTGKKTLGQDCRFGASWRRVGYAGGVAQRICRKIRGLGWLDTNLMGWRSLRFFRKTVRKLKSDCQII